jgi:hypothetical protein
MDNPLAIFEANKEVSTIEMNAMVVQLQDRLMEMEQVEIVTLHKFLPGIYERTIIIPPWTVLTGAEHRTAYKVRLERGTIAVSTDADVKILTGPFEFDAPAGFQRAGRVFEEEVVWTDIYANPDNCRNIEELENRLYVVPDIGLGEYRQLVKGELLCRDFGQQQL